MVIGASNYYTSTDTNSSGRAFVYRGSADGLPSEPTWTLAGGANSLSFGVSVASAGDVDGDGFADVLVGDEGFYCKTTNTGRAHLYYGSATGLQDAVLVTVSGEQQGENFGQCVAGAGDVNGDGLDDVFVSAALYENGEIDEGRALVFHGGGQEDSVVRYCESEANSTGVPAEIFTCGCLSAAEGDLTLHAYPVPSQLGIFFHGQSATQMPFGNGLLCTNMNLVRGSVVQVFTGLALASYTYNNNNPKHSLLAFAGTRRNFQCWFRDPMAGGAQFDTSDAIAILILP